MLMNRYICRQLRNGRCNQFVVDHLCALNGEGHCMMPCLPEHGAFSSAGWAPDLTLKTGCTYIAVVGTEGAGRNEQIVFI